MVDVVLFEGFGRGNKSRPGARLVGWQACAHLMHNYIDNPECSRAIEQISKGSITDVELYKIRNHAPLL